MKEVHKKIGLGSAQFGMDYGISNSRGKTVKDEVLNILQYAKKKGLRYVDTASAYGNAEEVLGHYDLKGFKIVSKFMPPENGSSVSELLERSLKRLNLQSLYGYLAHRPGLLLENPEQWEDLCKAKEEKKVQKIGFSLNRPSELEHLLNLGMFPDLIQAPYNLFDRRFEKPIRSLKKLGCEIHVRSAFLQGLFFVDPKMLPPHFDEVKEALAMLQKAHGNNLSGALLNYVLNKKFVDIVITGVENLGQLHMNMKNVKTAEPLAEPTDAIAENILMPALWPKE